MSSFIEIADHTLSAGTSELTIYTSNNLTVNHLSQVKTLRQLILVAGHAR